MGRLRDRHVRRPRLLTLTGVCSTPRQRSHDPAERRNELRRPREPLGDFQRAGERDGNWFTLACPPAAPTRRPSAAGRRPSPSIRRRLRRSADLHAHGRRGAGRRPATPTIRPNNMAVDFVVGFSAVRLVRGPSPPSPDPGQRPDRSDHRQRHHAGRRRRRLRGRRRASGLLHAGRGGRRRHGDLGRHLRLHRQRRHGHRRRVVRVTGFARERFNQTALNGTNSNTAAVPASNISHCGAGSVAATDVTLAVRDRGLPRAFRGHARPLPQALVISEYFNYERFGEIVLALPLPGETRPSRRPPSTSRARRRTRGARQQPEPDHARRRRRAEPDRPAPSERRSVLAGQPVPRRRHRRRTRSACWASTSASIGSPDRGATYTAINRGRRRRGRGRHLRSRR